LVKIYLLSLHGHIVALPAAEAESEPELPARGVLGWVARWFGRLQARLLRSDSAIGPRLERAWNWLHQWVAPDENLLLRLRSAREFDIGYPASQSQRAGFWLWNHYLLRRESSNFGWFLVNSFVLPFTLLLVPLPGPNVVGFWILYRAVCHLLILLGIRQAKKRHIPTAFQPCPALDAIPGEGDLARLKRIGPQLGVPKIESYVVWWTKRLPADHAAADALSSQQPEGVRRRRMRRFRAPTWIPNFLSALRIVLGLGFPWFPLRWRAGVIVAGGLSDMLDGAYCRVFRVSSITGQILDPIADKLFVACVLIVLLVEHRIRPGTALLVGFRDIAVVAGSATVVLRKGWSAMKHLPPSLVGKLTTAGQFGVLLALAAYPGYPGAARVLVPPTAVVSVLAGIDYLRRRH
jgi:phosphatidylglycerophosphate synthase